MMIIKNDDDNYNDEKIPVEGNEMLSVYLV